MLLNKMNKENMKERKEPSATVVCYGQTFAEAQAIAPHPPMGGLEAPLSPYKNKK